MNLHNMKLESVYAKGEDGEFHLVARRDECETSATAEKEYIEKGTVIDTLCGHFIPNRHKYIEEIRALPAADVQPVRRGEWKAEKEDVEWGCSTVRYRCSHCGRLPHFDKESFKFLLSDFCPKCGADMREGR